MAKDEISTSTLTDGEIKTVLAVVNKELDVAAGSVNRLARRRDELLAEQKKRATARPEHVPDALARKHPDDAS
jgi:hypothetical protein